MKDIKSYKGKRKQKIEMTNIVSNTRYTLKGKNQPNETEFLIKKIHNVHQKPIAHPC